MEISRIYDEIVIFENVAVIDKKGYKIVKGKHSIWIPDLEFKIPWTLNGKITSFKDWREGKDQHEIKYGHYGTKVKGFEDETLISIINEYTIFNELAKLNMGPKVSGLVYFKTAISDFFPGKSYEDKNGVYAYMIEDANRLRDGDFIFYEGEFNKYGWYQSEYLPPKFELQFLDRLIASKGAIGDMKKKDNIINGFLIDVRRTFSDMMVLKDLDISEKDKIDVWKILNS